MGRQRINSTSSPLRAIVIALGAAFALLPSTHALAHIALTSGVGGVFGTFTKGETALKTTGYAYGFGLNWHPEWKGQTSFVSLGLTGKQIKFGYNENHVNKRATLNLVGPSLGLFLPVSELFIVQILAQYYPGANLSTLSTNTVQLNGSSFKYSTWESFTGTAAYEGRINFTHDKADGQFNKKNRFRSGIGISYLQEDYFKSQTEVTTSKDELTPTATNSKDTVKDQLILVNVEFFLGITF